MVLLRGDGVVNYRKVDTVKPLSQAPMFHFCKSHRREETTVSDDFVPWASTGRGSERRLTRWLKGQRRLTRWLKGQWAEGGKKKRKENKKERISPNGF